MSSVETVLLRSGIVGATDKVGKVLAHHGVKGQRWGVTRSRAEIDSSTHVTQPKPGGKLKTSGGKGAPAHEDAIKTAHTRQLAKSSGLHAVGSKELQDAVNRMNLEANFSRLSVQRENKAKAFVRKLLGDIGKEQISKHAKSTVDAQLSDMLKEKKN